jgi:Protein of unknown function (DUF1236)
MSKALMVALLLTGLPAASYAEDNGVVGTAGAIARAPLDAAAGIVGGLTGAEGPRFHHYVVEQNVPSYTWANHSHVVVGDVLPAEGVILRPVPPDYHVTGGYQYTIVDNTPVLVDPGSRRIVEVVP